MKFLCSHCKAKYQIADEKVAGRTLRMTCRQCQQEIVIRGETPSAKPTVPPAESALGADFQRKLSGGARASVPPPPLPADAWHVAIDHVPVGPIRRDEVARRIAGGTVTADSLAWREGMDDWKPVRQVPELAVLVAPATPPSGAFPAPRFDIAPIGGRTGAAPAFSAEDWAAAAESSAMHPPRPSLADSLAPRASAMPSWGVMFAAACGFAFLMSVLTILGARWLSKSVPETPPPVAAATTGAPTQAQPVQAEPAQGEATEMVIELDEVPIDDATGKARTGTRTAAGTGKSTNGSKRNLTEAERAMLARMGGGTEPDLNLQGAQARPETRTTTRAGGLTAEDLSKVVMRGRKNLQRCYETALRGSGSSDTVRLDVTITVSANGNVTAVQTSGSGALPGMQQCIERTVKMWRFPSASEPTQSKFPLVFQPGA